MQFGSRLPRTPPTPRRESGERSDHPPAWPFRARLLRRQSSSLVSRSRYLAAATAEHASGAEGAAFALTGPLKPFNTCDTVLQYFKDQAPEYLIERAGGADYHDSEAGAAERTTAHRARPCDSRGYDR